MGIKNKTCKKCENKFHFDLKCCGYDPDHEYLFDGYCSRYCYLIHMKYKEVLIDFIRDPENLKIYLAEITNKFNEDDDIEQFINSLEPIKELRCK